MRLPLSPNATERYDWTPSGAPSRSTALVREGSRTGAFHLETRTPENAESSTRHRGAGDPPHRPGRHAALLSPMTRKETCACSHRRLALPHRCKPDSPWSDSPTAQAATACSKYAATNGTDTSAGTAAAPYRTVNRLVASLTAGQAGCLRAGAYTGGARIDHGGAPGNPIT